MSRAWGLQTSGLIITYISNVGSRLEETPHWQSESWVSVSIFPNAGPGHHLSSQQRHYHHNLSERGAKTLINVVIINNIHLSHLPLNCIKYVRERSRTSILDVSFSDETKMFLISVLSKCVLSINLVILGPFLCINQLINHRPSLLIITQKYFSC